jgi:hypothetical protein
MNAPLRPQEIRVDPLEVFELRCWARAELYAACEFELVEAVDILQTDAVASGLVAKLGQDKVQLILRDAFHRVRGRE